MNIEQKDAQELFKLNSDLTIENEFAKLAKALAHPARLRILKILIKLDNQGGCINRILVPKIGLAQSTVSEHLKVLKKAGFIRCESKPPKVCYFVNKEKLKEFSILFTENYL